MGTSDQDSINLCFHSISFPSEWGPSTSSRMVRVTPSHAALLSYEVTSALPTWHLLPSFHSISFPSEWGPHNYTSHTAQCVHRPFARTPKNLCINKLSPAIKIDETLTGQYIEGSNQLTPSQRFAYPLAKLPDRPPPHRLDIIKSVPLSPQSP